MTRSKTPGEKKRAMSGTGEGVDQRKDNQGRGMDAPAFGKKRKKKGGGSAGEKLRKPKRTEKKGRPKTKKN